MKRRHMAMGLAASWLLAGGAFAQTCTPAAGAITDTSGVINVDTCSSTDQLTSICNSSTPIGNAADTIYLVSALADIGAQVAVTPAGYDAYVALLQGTCSGGSTCVRESDNPGIGAAESVSFVGLNPGTYFLLVTSFAASGNCGATSIQPLPTPVALRSFSID